MSIRTMALVWEQSQHSGSELLVLLGIADFSDDQGKAYPAISTLAKKCRMSNRHVQRVVRGIEQSGELTVKSNGGPPPKFPNLYKINIDSLGVTHASGVTSEARRGDIQGTKGVTRMSPKPSLNRQEPPKRFSEFWDAFPNCKRKGSKAKCQSVWQKNKLDSLADEIIAHVDSMAASEDWLKDSGKYIPAPLVYLNQQRWDGAEVGTQAISNEVIF